MTVIDDVWHLVYTQYGADDKIYYYRCDDNNWQPRIELYDGSGSEYWPNVLLQNNNHVWVAELTSGNSVWWESLDGGASFGPMDTRDAAAASVYAKSEIFNLGDKFVAFLAPSSTSGNGGARIVTSDDEGENWSAVQTIITTNAASYNTSDGCCDEEMSTLYVVAGLDSGAIKFRKSTDFGDTWEPAVTISSGHTELRAINIVARSGHIFVAWRTGTMTTNISYSHDDGDTWSTLGTPLSGSVSSWRNCMCISNQGISIILGTMDGLERHTSTIWESGAPSFSLDGSYGVPSEYSGYDEVYLNIAEAAMPRHGMAHNKKSFVVSYEIQINDPNPRYEYPIYAIDDANNWTLLDLTTESYWEFDLGSSFCDEDVAPPLLTSTRSGAKGSFSGRAEDGGGFSVVVFKPSIVADGSNVIYTPRGAPVDNIAHRLTSYNHEIRRYGGYWSASMDLKLPKIEAETWFMEGLGWHVVVVDGALTPIWEGFINEVTYTIGGLEATRGPLTDICNRCSVVYSIFDASTTPPNTGVRMTTLAVDDEDSQLKYGIWDKIIGAGGMDNTAGVLEADQLRDTYIAEHHEPETSQRVALFGRNENYNIHLECLGYSEFLKFPYNQTVTSGVVTVTEKIAAILDADPNGLFSSDNAELATNNVLTHAWENENNTAWDLLLDLAKMGGAEYQPYNFGIYNNRRVVYEEIPETVEYFQALYDNRLVIEDASGNEIKPWRVRPGKWKMQRDLLVGRVPGSTPFMEDPRMAFIESVQFSMPNKLTITSNKIGTVAQRITSMATEVTNKLSTSLIGSARTIRDLWIDAAGIKAPGAKPATEVSFGALEVSAWEFSDEGVEANQESVSWRIAVPYDMDRSVGPSLRIGWSSASTGNCKWQLKYRWFSEDEDLTQDGEETLTTTDAASATANGLVITTITGIDAPSSSDATIMFKLTRLSADAADTISDTVELHGVCFNYTSDKLGEAA